MEIRPQDITYSEEVHDILTQIPNAVIRWGITVVASGVALLLFLSWVVQYPDVIKGRISIVAANPPATLVATTSAPVKWLVDNNSAVTEQQAVLYFFNSARYDDVIQLKNTLNGLQEKVYQGNNFAPRLLNPNWQLGELQSAFNDLLKSVQQSELLHNNQQLQDGQSHTNQQQIAKYREIIAKIKQQITLADQEHQQIQQQINVRYRPLYQSGAIAKADLEQQENKLLQIEKNIENLQANIHQTETQILALQGKQQEFGYQQSNDNLNFKTNIINAFSALQSQISIWEQRYLLKSPINGKLQYVQNVKDNTVVAPQQELAAIIPQNDSAYEGELTIPSAGSGKVKVGQTVQINLDDFNKKEYGMLIGTVGNISPINNKNTYQINVSLNNGLETTQHLELSFKHGMQGEANIITQKQRFISRIFSQLKGVFEGEV